jgi:hypothetical protein
MRVFYKTVVPVAFEIFKGFYLLYFAVKSDGRECNQGGNQNVALQEAARQLPGDKT